MDITYTLIEEDIKILKDDLLRKEEAERSLGEIFESANRVRQEIIDLEWIYHDQLVIPIRQALFDTAAKMEKWCEENKVGKKDCYVSPEKGHFYFVFTFEDVTDAVAFKLRWT